MEGEQSVASDKPTSAKRARTAGISRSAEGARMRPPDEAAASEVNLGRLFRPVCAQVVQ